MKVIEHRSLFSYTVVDSAASLHLFFCVSASWDARVKRGKKMSLLHQDGAPSAA